MTDKLVREPNPFKEKSILGGTDKPTESNRYLARDGKYYNGYALSTDCAEDYFGDAFKKIAKEIEKELERSTTK